MTERTLFIAAYDVSHPRRLREALDVLRDYAGGRQKSVFECYLSAVEKHALLAEVRGVIDQREDRFFLLRIETRGKVRTLGKALKPQDSNWFYVG